MIPLETVVEADIESGPWKYHLGAIRTAVAVFSEVQLLDCEKLWELSRPYRVQSHEGADARAGSNPSADARTASKANGRRRLTGDTFVMPPPSPCRSTVFGCYFVQDLRGLSGRYQGMSFRFCMSRPWSYRGFHASPSSSCV